MLAKYTPIYFFSVWYLAEVLSQRCVDLCVGKVF